MKDLKKQKLFNYFKSIEIDLLPVLIDMQFNGIFIDKDYLENRSNEIGKKIESLESEIIDLAGEEFNLNSSQQLAVILFDKLKLDKGKKSKTILTSSSLNSILDSVATRLNEARDLTRYVINLLIFLGLLGTFYGLAITVPEVVNTIKSLVPKEGQTGIEVFDNLMAGLEGQLGGMGTAFASSLLGLAGSLVVGLLELFANHGQN